MTPLRYSFIACLCAVLAASPGTAQTTYSASDKSISFTYPEGWKVVEEGGKVRITAPDGARYTLVRDPLSSSASGDAANNAGLRSAAENLVKPLISSPTYAGVRPVTVGAGSGAAYRFRGKGTASEIDLAEVWFAIGGSHSVAVIPDTAPQPDHSFELGTIFKSLALAGASRSDSSGRRPMPTDLGVKKPDPPRPRDEMPADRMDSRSETTRPATGFEEYSGHLIPTDVSFTMRLMDNRTATGNWVLGPGRYGRYSGKYTGQDGAYVVNLSRNGIEDSGMARTLTLYLRGIGGMMTGQFSRDNSLGRKDIAEIKLSSVDGIANRRAGPGMRGAGGGMRGKGRQGGRGGRG